MISLEEIESEIVSLNNEKPSYSVMEKLAAMYTVRDHMTESGEVVVRESEIVPHISDSEFGQKIEGKDAGKIWKIIDDLMATIRVVNPRLYAGVMREL